MRKIFLIILIFFINFGILSADSGISSVSWLENSGLSECGTSHSHGKIHYGVPDNNTGEAEKNGNTSCTTHTYSGNTYRVKIKGNGITPCEPGDRAIRAFWGRVICEKYDDTPPGIGDFSFQFKNYSGGSGVDPMIKGGFLMANNYNIDFEIKKDTGTNSADIVKVETQMEDPNNQYNTINKTHTNIINFDYSSIYNDNLNLTKVDNFRNNNNFREYTYRVVDACDRAGNCLSHVNSGGKNITYKVYANYIERPSIVEPTGDVADGKEKEFRFTLRDKFGNSVVPVKDFSGEQIRELTFDTNYDNDLFLDQYKKEGESGIYGTGFYSGEISKYIPLEIGKNKQIRTNISDLSSRSGDYFLSFKPYSPTYFKDSDDGRQYVDGNFKLTSDTTVKLSDKIIPDRLLLPRELQYKPKFYIEIEDIKGGIVGNGLIVGTRQDSRIILKENQPGVLNGDILLEYGYIDESDTKNKYKSHKNFILSFNKDGSSSWENIVSGKQKNHSLLTKFGDSTSSIFTNLYQIGRISEAEQKTYFATHIRDDIYGKVSVYNSFILGMDRYNGKLNSSNNTYQRPLKIIGTTHSTYYSEVVDGDTGDKISLLGNTEKANLQKHIRKMVIDSIRNIKFNNFDRDIIISSLNFNASNFEGVIIGDTAYISNINGKKVILESDLDFIKYSGVKNLVVYGGDIYIKDNILSNNLKNDFLSIIAVQDLKYNGGNIYIDPSVTRVESILYADKSLLSYFDGKVLSPGNGGNYDLLKNQLYIYGSVFSNNTIGGSINVDSYGNSKPICPYYVKVNCDIDESQKYDFYNFRRGYENILKNDKKTLKDEYIGRDVKYPLIIEYNPSIQTKNIKFFRVDNS